MHFHKKGWIYVIGDIAEFEQQCKEGRVFMLGEDSKVGVFIAYAMLPIFSPNFSEEEKNSWITSRDKILKNALRDLGAMDMKESEVTEAWQGFQGGLDQMK